MRKVFAILAVVALLLPAAVAMGAEGPIDQGSSIYVKNVQFAAGDDPMVRTVTVQIDLENIPTLAAIDLPLNYGQPGDGVNLLDVRYGSRVEYFDIKITNIDNENKNVVIGLIALATDPNTPDLPSGKGTIAYLTFEITDNTMNEFTISDTQMENPSHRLLLVSHVISGPEPDIAWEEPDFNYTVNLSTAGVNIPTSYALLQNYPNPFNAGTVIRFNVPRTDMEVSNVKLVIYNVLGQSVRTLVDDNYAPGTYDVSWDGSANNGDPVASGVYFYRIQAGGFLDTKKMTLLK